MGIKRHTPLFCKHVEMVAPVDSNGAAQGGNFNFVSMRNYATATVCISVGVHSGAAAAVTLRQAKNVEGNGSKALAFTDYYEEKPTASPPETSDMWTKRTATSNTFNIAANTVYKIPVKQAMLDVTNNFDCIRPALAAPGAATLVHIWIELSDGPVGLGDAGAELASVPSAKVNKMPN